MAGIEFPFAIEAGKIQGKKIGDLVNKLPFKRTGHFSSTLINK
jgi:hypothetical protein